MTDPDERARLKRERLATLRAGFIGELPQRLAEIDALWSAVVAGNGGAEDREALYRAVHSISGACAMLGLADLSAGARSFEATLAPLRGDAPPPAPELVEEVEQRRRELQAALEAARNTAD